MALAIKTYYPREFIFPNEAALSMWYEELKDLDYDSAGIGLRKYVLTNRLPPAISDIRAYASAVDAGTRSARTRPGDGLQGPWQFRSPCG